MMMTILCPVLSKSLKQYDGHCVHRYARDCGHDDAHGYIRVMTMMMIRLCRAYADYMGHVMVIVPTAMPVIVAIITPMVTTAL